MKHAIKAYIRIIEPRLEIWHQGYIADLEMGHGYVPDGWYDDLQEHYDNIANQVAERFGITGDQLISALKDYEMNEAYHFHGEHL